MKTNSFKKYQKQKADKLDVIGTGITIERKQKVFVDSNNLNLSLLVRDALDSMMDPVESPLEKQVKAVIKAFVKGSNTDQEIEKLQKLIESEE